MSGDEIIALLALFDGFVGPSADELWWRTDGEYAPITFLVNCNDLFMWGCADCERISTADVSDFRAAIEDSKDEHGNSSHASLLWVARKRKLRPQAAYYEYFSDKEKLLFDACGSAGTQYGR